MSSASAATNAGRALCCVAWAWRRAGTTEIAKRRARRMGAPKAYGARLQRIARRTPAVHLPANPPASRLGGPAVPTVLPLRRHAEQHVHALLVGERLVPAQIVPVRHVGGV